MVEKEVGSIEGESCQEESDNLIQPHDHLTEIQEEEKEKVTFMKYDVYSAAEKGEINPVIEQRKDSLKSLLTPQKNTVLHIYLTSITRKIPKLIKFVEGVLGLCPALHIDLTSTILGPQTSKEPEPQINEFVERILGFCPALLMQTNTKGETPLHIAARYGHASIVNQLIKHAKEDHPDHHNQDHESHGAEEAKNNMLRMTSKEEDTALHEAVRFQRLDVVKILIREDGDFEHNANKSGETPLYLAVERGYNDIANEIIQHCNSPATAGPNGRNVLHAAAIREDKGLIESILEKFGEQMLKQRDQKGWTPLHCAARMGNLDAVKMFLTKEMGREAAYMKNTDGDTALHLAAVFNNKATMLEIIKWCPDSSELVNEKGWNILHSSVQNSYCNALTKDILQSRTSFSNLINEKDGDGNTPLHIAVEMDSLDIVETLNDDPRVDKLAFNNENKNALDLYIGSHPPWLDHHKNIRKIKGLRSNMRIHTEIKDSKQDKKDESLVDKLKKFQDANTIVAALIATVTFTAGFTVHKGFVSEKGPLEGTPILGRDWAFKTFIIMDTIAMVLSTSSVFIRLFIDFKLKITSLSYLVVSSFFLTSSAMVAMLVAFATGTYALSRNPISFSIIICVLTLSFFILLSCFLYLCLRRK